ncbi:MAG: phosphate-starvation-inducible PsiE family protein [Nitrospirae bacterium]|nr:phosphate-starvation-inducible PsiE family protein [Nitrospirota bacterium]
MAEGKKLPWTALVEKFEGIVVAALALLLVVIVAVILGVVAYLFVSRLGTIVTGIEDIADLQQAALRAFSGILLVLLGLELLDTVKVYFREHTVRVEVILLVGLIAMGRHVLEIDLHHIEPLILFGFSSLLLALAFSYFLVKRAQSAARNVQEHEDEEYGGIL